MVLIANLNENAGDPNASPVDKNLKKPNIYVKKLYVPKYLLVLQFCAGGVAKKKWRALRENYHKEQSKKRSTTGQAAGDNGKSRWAHYDDLSFLQDQFVSRVTLGSMGPGLNSSEDRGK